MNGQTEKPVIGIVGGIGSGKSAVAAELARHGGRVLDADSYGHEALRQPAIIDQVRDRWGRDVVDVDGVVDRRKLAGIVFAKPEERAKLEGIVFPWIEKRIREEFARAQEDPEVPFLVLDAAIMFETGWNGICDKVVFVDAPWSTRMQRLNQRQGWSAEEVRRREAAQMAIEEKSARADATIVNNGTLENLRFEVRRLAAEWGLHEKCKAADLGLGESSTRG